MAQSIPTSYFWNLLSMCASWGGGWEPEVGRAPSCPLTASLRDRTESRGSGPTLLNCWTRVASHGKRQVLFSLRISNLAQSICLYSHPLWNEWILPSEVYNQEINFLSYQVWRGFRIVRSKQGVCRLEFQGHFHGSMRLFQSWVLGSITLAKFIRVGIM